MESSNHSINLIANPEQHIDQTDFQTFASIQKPFGVISLKKKIIKVSRKQKNIAVNVGSEFHDHPLANNQEATGKIPIRKVDQLNPYSKLEKVKRKINIKNSPFFKPKISKKNFDPILNEISETNYVNELKMKDVNCEPLEVMLEELKPNSKILNDIPNEDLNIKEFNVSKQNEISRPSYINEFSSKIETFDANHVKTEDIASSPHKSVEDPFFTSSKSVDIDSELSDEISLVCQPTNLLLAQIEDQIVPNQEKNYLVPDILPEVPFFKKAQESESSSCLKPNKIVGKQELFQEHPTIYNTEDKLENFEDSVSSTPGEIHLDSNSLSLRIVSDPNRLVSLGKPINRATSFSYSPEANSLDNSLLLDSPVHTKKSRSINNPITNDSITPEYLSSAKHHKDEFAAVFLSSNLRLDLSKDIPYDHPLDDDILSQEPIISHESIGIMNNKPIQSSVISRDMYFSSTKTTNFESERSGLTSRESGRLYLNFNDYKEEIGNNISIETNEVNKKAYLNGIKLHEIEEHNGIKVAEEEWDENPVIEKNAIRHQLLPNLYEKKLNPDNEFIHLDIENISDYSRKSDDGAMISNNMHIGVYQESLIEECKEMGISNDIEVEGDEYNSDEPITRRALLYNHEFVGDLEKSNIIKAVRFIWLFILVRVLMSVANYWISFYFALLHIWDLIGGLSVYYLQITWCSIYCGFLIIDLLFRANMVAYFVNITFFITGIIEILFGCLIIFADFLIIRKVLFLISILGKLSSNNLDKVKETIKFCKKTLSTAPEN